MPVTFRQIAAKTAKVTLRIKGDSDNDDITITIVYYPNKFTRELLEKAQAGEVTDKEYFPTLIKSWDIIDDSVDPPEMFPIERIDEFGLPFMRQIAQALGEDMRPNLLSPQMNGNGNKSI
jgi:hypothetical protein